MGDAPLLIAENLHKRYGDVEILKGLDFSIGKGENCSIVGKSGSGKSTLLNLLALLDRKDGGKIYYEEKDTDTFSEKDLVALRRNTVSFVFQNSLLLEDFSALENVMIALFIAGFSKKEAWERATEVLESVGLKDRMNHRPKELSGGERQRTAISRAVASSSSLIFLDEPTGSLDEEARFSVENLLFSSPYLQKKAFIIVTHDSDLSLRTSKRYLLKGGVLETV